MAKQKQQKSNITNEDISQIILLQVFSIILFLKGISATYHATMYAETGQTWIIKHYAEMFRVAPLPLLFPLFALGINILFNFNQKTKRWINIISVIFTIISSFVVLWLF